MKDQPNWVDKLIEAVTGPIHIAGSVEARRQAEMKAALWELKIAKEAADGWFPKLEWEPSTEKPQGLGFFARLAICAWLVAIVVAVVHLSLRMELAEARIFDQHRRLTEMEQPWMPVPRRVPEPQPEVSF